MVRSRLSAHLTTLIPGPSEDMFVVQVYVNEEPVLIPACNDYVCRYKDVRDGYKHHVDHCNFQSTCSWKTDHDEL